MQNHGDCQIFCNPILYVTSPASCLTTSVGQYHNIVVYCDIYIWYRLQIAILFDRKLWALLTTCINSNNHPKYLNLSTTSTTPPSNSNGARSSSVDQCQQSAAFTQLKTKMTSNFSILEVALSANKHSGSTKGLGLLILSPTYLHFDNCCLTPIHTRHTLHMHADTQTHMYTNAHSDDEIIKTWHSHRKFIKNIL